MLSPFILVLEPATAWRDIRANQQIVVERAAGTFGYARTALRYGMLLWRDTVTWPVIVLAATGLLVLGATRPAMTALLLAFPIPFFLFIAGTFPATRYLIPLVPFLAVFAGVAVSWIAQRLPIAAIAIASPGRRDAASRQPSNGPVHPAGRHANAGGGVHRSNRARAAAPS